MTLKYLAAGSFTAEETADPIFDCLQVARNSERPEWVALTENEDKNKGAVLPYRPVKALFNGLWEHDGKGWNQGILVLTNSGLAHIKEQLDWRHPEGEPRLHSDRRWSKYLLGDVTSPKEGLMASVYKTAIGTTSSEPYCLHYTTKAYVGKGAKTMAVDDDVLSRRVVLGSSKTLKIPTYQEIVDIIQADTVVPMELLKQACGKFANIPEKQGPRFTQESTSLPQREHVSKPPQRVADEDFIPMGHDSAATPPDPEDDAPPPPEDDAPPPPDDDVPPPAEDDAPPPPEDDAPPPPVEEAKFWVSVGGQVTQLRESEVRELAAGNPKLRVLSDEAKKAKAPWGYATDYGLVASDAPAPPALQASNSSYPLIAQKGGNTKMLSKEEADNLERMFALMVTDPGAIPTGDMVTLTKLKAKAGIMPVGGN